MVEDRLYSLGQWRPGFPVKMDPGPFGIERIAMLKYGIPDVRAFYESDLRWLRHYGFLPLDIPSLVRGPLSGGAAA